MTRRHHAGRAATSESVNNGRSVTLPPAPFYRRGMQPKPQDARGLYRETVRISFALKCLENKRSQIVVVLDRWDTRRAKMRRELDSLLTQLEHASPELYARAEERRREWDNPKAALAWAMNSTEEPIT